MNTCIRRYPYRGYRFAKLVMASMSGPSRAFMRDSERNVVTTRASSRTSPVGGGRAPLPFFCGDFLHQLDFEVPLGEQLLQPGVLLLQLSELLHIIGGHAAETLSPRVDRLLADAVALSDLGYRITVRLARVPTICSSENLPFLMAPSLSVGATFSSFSWSEKSRAGHARF
jgi:hypothetical protein